MTGPVGFFFQEYIQVKGIPFSISTEAIFVTNYNDWKARQILCKIHPESSNSPETGTLYCSMKEMEDEQPEIKSNTEPS